MREEIIAKVIALYDKYFLHIEDLVEMTGATFEEALEATERYWGYKFDINK